MFFGSLADAQQLPGQVLNQPAAVTGQPADEAIDELQKLAKSLEKAKEKKKKENLPPFEFFLSHVAPFDVLPLVKPYHWFTMAFQLQSNGAPYDGLIQTTAERSSKGQIMLPETPRAMVYSRQALLPADKRVERSMQMMLPEVPPLPDTPRLLFDLGRAGSFRADASFEAQVQKLEAHQMVVIVLSSDPNQFSNWDKTQAALPSSIDREQRSIDRDRYYRLVLPLNPGRPFLSPHPLTWTTISHVIWEGFSPELLGKGGFSVQQAMLDWLHWGGQLVVLANSPNATQIEDSVLGPYLPAKITGQVEPLGEQDLNDLSESFLPPVWGKALDEYEFPLGLVAPGGNQSQTLPVPPRFKPAEPIKPAESRPISAAGLERVPGRDGQVIPFGPTNQRVLAVERRVGRGRLTMLAINPNDPTLSAWPGLDTLLRTVVFRRAEEKWSKINSNRYAYQPLGGRDLNWTRFLARDLGATVPPVREEPIQGSGVSSEIVFPKEPVAAWSDTTSELPILTREILERSSGIRVPGSRFVMSVILAYILALSPVNWILCHFGFRRKELAWIISPLLAMAFALGVERASAVNLGYTVASDEIDLLEIQGGYSRAHLTRLASIYSTNRHAYSVTESGNPTSLVLPMKSFTTLRREETRVSRYETTPEPRLSEFLVQPRSLDMFRAEALVDLGGSIVLEGTPQAGTLTNGTDLELLDAVLIDTASGEEIALGRIGPWAGNPTSANQPGDYQVQLPRPDSTERSVIDPALAWADHTELLTKLREYRWNKPFELGEVRLVAWAREAHPGLAVSPLPDRRRGIRLVVAHLRYGLAGPTNPAYLTVPAKPEKKAEETSSRSVHEMKMKTESHRHLAQRNRAESSPQ